MIYINYLKKDKQTKFQLMCVVNHSITDIVYNTVKIVYLVILLLL